MQGSPPPRKRVPAAWAVLAVSLALLLVLLYAIGLIAWNSYREAIDRSRAQAATAAQVVATHAQWLTAASLLIMEDCDRVVGDTITTMHDNAAEELRLHLRHMPAGVSLSLTDDQGRLRYAEGGPGAPLGAGSGLLVSQLTPERPWYVSAMVPDAGGGHSFLLAHRLERAGRVIGAAVVRIPVAVTAVPSRALDLGSSAAIGLLREDGLQVARDPPAGAPPFLGDDTLFTDHLKKSPAGVYETVSPSDGEYRIVGYRKVPNAPLVAVASIPESDVMVRLGERMKRLALFLVPIMLGLGVLSVWVVRLLRRDQRMRADLAAAGERNNLLMREIHHRTKNNLQSVASLINLQPISEEAKTAMTSRIAAMSALHEQAYRSDQYSEVKLRDYLLTLAKTIGKTCPEGVTITTDLAEASIDRDLAQPLGLIVNEVISNAIKHAFHGRPGGAIVIRLRLLADDRAELTVQDDGTGFTREDCAAGMGSRLIRAFAQQLGNDYSYQRENGTRFAIRFAARPEAAA